MRERRFEGPDVIGTAVRRAWDASLFSGGIPSGCNDEHPRPRNGKRPERMPLPHRSPISCLVNHTDVLLAKTMADATSNLSNSTNVCTTRCAKLRGSSVQVSEQVQNERSAVP